MKTLAALSLSYLCAIPVLFGAVPAEQIDEVAHAAQAAPGEFAADALLRLAGLDTVDKPKRIAWLEEAFVKAGAAQQPYKRRAATLSLDGTPGYLNRVYGQDLDQLSLRLRAVDAMLPLDSAKARALFLQIPPVKLPALTCSDFLVYDVAPFYEVLGRVLQQSFTSAEVNDGTAARLLQRYAGAFTSPVQVTPLARLLATSGAPDKEFQSLVAAFGGALGKIGEDDRSFSTAYTVGTAVQSLVEECKRRKISPLPLIESYRVYLVIHLSSARCGDNDLMRGGQQSFGIFTGQEADQQVADFVSFFNQKLVMPPLQPIRELEATPARLEGVATGLRLCQDAECQAISRQYVTLILGSNNQPYLPAQRNTTEWREKLRAFVDALAAWKGGDASPEEFYREKAGTFGQLLNLVEGSDRDTVLHAQLEFIRQSPIQASDRMDWFLPVNAMIGRTGIDPGLAKFAAELRESANPVIALYARLEAVAPRTADRLLPLL